MSELSAENEAFLAKIGQVVTPESKKPATKKDEE
jgi:hypothetical protein